MYLSVDAFRHQRLCKLIIFFKVPCLGNTTGIFFLTYCLHIPQCDNPENYILNIHHVDKCKSDTKKRGLVTLDILNLSSRKAVQSQKLYLKAHKVLNSFHYKFLQPYVHSTTVIIFICQPAMTSGHLIFFFTQNQKPFDFIFLCQIPCPKIYNHFYCQYLFCPISVFVRACQQALT